MKSIFNDQNCCVGFVNNQILGISLFSDEKKQCVFCNEHNHKNALKFKTVIFSDFSLIFT